MNTKTFIAIITVACATLYACSVNDNNISPTVQNLTPKEQWGPTCKGADFTVPQLPDLYVNYWEYSYSVDENANLALKISGQFPSCRYFSFSTYNDENGDVISGISDFEIIPDEGSVNPFVQTSTAKNFFTVYIVPATATDAQIAKLPSKNIIHLGDTIHKACLIIREYLGIDEFGGVDLPAIQAYDMNTMKCRLLFVAPATCGASLPNSSPCGPMPRPTCPSCCLRVAPSIRTTLPITSTAARPSRTIR